MSFSCLPFLQGKDIIHLYVSLHLRYVHAVLLAWTQNVTTDMTGLIQV